MVHTVGIAEMMVAQGNGESLITYSLGSCVGITLYDPVLQVGGLVHCMLPMSKLDKEKAQKKPCMFTDTGIMKLLESMYELGVKRQNLVAKVAGGGSPLKTNNTFNIGDRNVVVLRKMLWKNNILIAAEDVGGTKPRTMTLCIASGVTTIKFGGYEEEL